MSDPSGSSEAHSYGTAAHNSDRNPSPITFTAEELSPFRQGISDGVDRSQRKQLVQWEALYKSKGWCNESLSEYYAKDFKPYFEEHFAEVSANTLRELRDVLRRQDIYVKKGRNVLIATALYEVVRDNIP